ncbi:hypothetical protein E4U09_008018 [Claviceps aff. purpurea]|uniref:Uncharacterized protein n=1 Tax=Claviceps aff. purpurea TaxID=1967640 RepID=A0A9P7QRM0_9HYPO|nr:hypothetical protein E4U09_008018 [Claviceps aff. purpurea]
MCQGHILRMPVSPIGSTHPFVCPGGGSKIRASIFSSSASTHEDLPGALNRIVRIFDRSCPLGRIASPRMQFESHHAMAEVAFKARYMPTSLDLQASQSVHKTIRTLHSTTTGDLACPASTDYYASH